jgi:hypothetical protein
MAYAVYRSASELPLHDGDATRWSIALTALDDDEDGTTFIEVYVTEPPETEGKQLGAWLVDRIEAVHPPSNDYLATLEAAQPICLDA